MLVWRFVDSMDLSEREYADMLELFVLYNDCDEASAPSYLPTKGVVCLFRRPGSRRLEAFFAQSESLTTIEGEDILLLELSSFYARKSARGDAGLLLAALQSLLRLWWRHPRVRWYAMSDVCEPSYRWFAKNLREVWSLRHPHLPKRERLILEQVGRVLPGAIATFEPSRGTLRYPDPMTGVEQRQWDDDAGREFRRLLPDADPCEMLLIIAELSRRNTLPALRRLWTRLRRRRTAADR